MTHTRRIAIALRAAVVGASLLGGAAAQVRADSVWIDPVDPSGEGSDPNASLNLSTSYDDALHWNPMGVPGSGAAVFFDVPGYPSTAYTISFPANTQADRVTVSNLVTFNLSSSTFTLTHSASAINDVSLLISNQKSLTLRSGTIEAQSVQIGTISGTASQFTLLTIDGGLGDTAFNVAANQSVFNYASISVINGGTFSVGDYGVLDQAPDLAGGGLNSGITVVNGTASHLLLGDSAMVRGGTLRSVNGGVISALGTSLTYDSLYYDADLLLNNPAFTLNLTSTLRDPNNGNAIVYTTIAGQVNISDGTLNIVDGAVRATSDGGINYNAFTISGNAHATLTNSTLTTGLLDLDGSSAPGAGAQVFLQNSTVSAHGDMIIGLQGNIDVTASSGGSAIQVDGALTLGEQKTAVGSLTLSGVHTSLVTGLQPVNSQFFIGDIIVGGGGAGIMTVAAGASVAVSHGYSAYVGLNNNGDGTGGNGTLTITGGAGNGTQSTLQSVFDLLSSGGSLYVGVHAASSGMVRLENGGLLRSVNGRLGVDANATGTIFLDGGFANADNNTLAPSQWLASGSIVIGDAGIGQLSLTQGALASSGGSLIIANQTGSSGHVFVGTHSVLTVNQSLTTNDQLTIGGDGDGSLELVDSGTITISGSAVLANGSGSTGTVDLSLASVLSATQDLITGSSGAGTLTLHSNSQVTDRVGRIAFLTGSSGQVLVDHSSWSNATLLEIAASGTATLTVQNAGSVTAGSVQMSFFGGSSSNVTVDGAGSVLNDSGLLVVGGSGAASLTITHGGSVSNTTASIALNAGGVGSVLVSGAGSSWSSAGEMLVGAAGAGSLTIANGASVTTAADVVIGAVAGSNGTAGVDASVLAAQSFITVGDAGTGRLEIHNGGTVTAGQSIIAGFQQSASGTILIDGPNSILTHNSFSNIGLAGTGSLTIQGGARFTETGSGSIGVNATGHGDVTVSGASSLWTLSFIRVGVNGTGTLTIENGGLVVNALSATAGVNASGSGTVVVTGGNSLWTINSTMQIGASGYGSLSVLGGGEVNVGGVAYVGFGAGSSGQATVSGAGSQLNSAAQVVIGADGTGSLAIASGGLVTAAAGFSATGSAATIGQEANGLGVVTVTNAGSRLALAGHLNVGLGQNGLSTSSGGTGQLNILNGGQVTDINAYVGRYNGSSGTAIVSGTGSSWQNSGRFFIAANDTANNPGGLTLAAGAGNVTVGAGAAISAATGATIGAAGVLNMQGGLFTAPAITLNGLLRGNGDVYGSIAGTGTVQAESPAPLNTDAVRVGSIIVADQGALVIRPNNAYIKTSALSIAHTGAGTAAAYTGVLQLNNNRMILQATGTASKAAGILALNEALFAGKGTANVWTGTAGITSSTVLNDPSRLTMGVFDNAVLGKTNWAGGIGNVDSNSLLVTAALKGDANLDGIVNFNDMLVVTGNWNAGTYGGVSGISAIDMAHGDLNADGIVNFNDMLVVTGNWNNSSSMYNLVTMINDGSLVAQLDAGQGLNLSPGQVPEPATAGLLALGAVALLRRRKNRK